MASQFRAIGALSFRARVVIVMFAMLSVIAASEAQERIIPTPRITIYPGDTIKEAMLVETSVFVADDADEALVESMAGLVGKVAKRTLLPGRPIGRIAVDAPRLVSVGAQVKIVFSENGLIITAYGTALQGGAVGDLVRVRNQDSGLSISGRVQQDGSIRVSEG